MSDPRERPLVEILYALSCRVYRTDGGIAGEPDERWVRDALRREAAA